MFNIFGKKGQSSSVFNLLIAALVSLAILGLLLGVLGGLDLFGGGQKPGDTASKLLSDASNYRFSPYTDAIIFSKKYPVLTAKALGEKLDVGDNVFIKLCKDPQNVEASSDFKLLNYKGTSNQKYYATAICGIGPVDASSGLPEGCEPEDATVFSCYLFIRPFEG